jgi:PhzF family phenazine biosynthesis protein
MSTTTAPFYLITAFSTSPFSGNPAAIVFLDTLLPVDWLGKIAQNFNQPITTFVSTTSLPSDDDKIEVRNIRFFVPNGQEIPICGHGTLAAGKAIFGMPEIVARGVHTIHFKRPRGSTLKAVKLDDGFIELRIPATVPGSVSDEDKARLKTFVDKAFGRDVVIKDIRNGGSAYESYVMVELDESEDLAGSSVNAKELLGNGFMVNVFTTSSPNPGESFVSRMFAPTMITEPHEDHVCGSAHGILAPYWYAKRGIKSGEEVKAKMVSLRGGDLNVVLEEAESTVKLRGQAVILANGELQL